MCEPTTIAALATAVAGAGVNQYNNSQVIKKKDKIEADNILKQAGYNTEASDEVANATKELANSNADSETSTQKANYAKALGSTQSSRSGALSSQTGSSKRYAEDVSAAKAASNAQATASAGNMAAADAATLQRQDENAQTGDLASDLGLIANSAKTENALSKIRQESVAANPWLEGVATALQAYGAVAGAGAGAGTAGTSASINAGTGAADYLNGLQGLYGMYGSARRYS